MQEQQVQAPPASCGSQNSVLRTRLLAEHAIKLAQPACLPILL
jgi:hypothetical protein